MEDYYSILQIPKNASEDDIKKSYKKLSLLYHPDRNPDKKDWAEDMFKKLNHAKNVLLDPQQRHIYDTSGEEGLKRNNGNQNNFDMFNNIFRNNTFFKGFNEFTNIFQNKNNQKHKQNFQEYMSLEQVYKGYKMSKKLKITDNCKKCEGTGKEQVTICSQCSGRGVNMVIQQIGPNMITQTQAPCDKCSAIGKIGSGNNCSKCIGSKSINRIIEINLDYPPGFKNKDIYLSNFENYEFVFEANIREHHLYQRDGDNLLHKANITLSDALCGLEYHLKFLDDSNLIIKSKENQVIKPNTTYTIPGKGITSKGNLIISFNIQFPNKLTSNEKESLKDILGYSKKENNHLDFTELYLTEE